MLKKLFSLFLALTLLFSPLASFAGTWGQQSKPPVGAQIDFSHPLAKGLVGAWLMNEGGGIKTKDLIKSYIASFVSSPTWKQTSKGNAINFIATSDQYLNCGNILNFTSENFTFITCIRNTVAASRAVLFFKGAYQVKGYYIQIDPTGTRQGSISLNTNQASANQRTDSIASAIPLNEFCIVSVVRNGNSCRIFVNNKEVTYAVVGTHLNPLTSTDNFLISRYSTTAQTYNLTGQMLFAYVYNRALSPSEIQALYIDPYCFIRQDYRLYYVPTSAVTAVFRSQIINIQTW